MGFIGVQPTSAPLTASDISADIINSTHIGDTAISGFTALTEAPADTDEFLISDNGVLKRIDASFVGGGVDGVTSASSSTALSIDANGHVTQPLQSTFMLQQTGALTVANTHTIFSNNTTERWDVNSDVSGSTFTAPVTGKYYLVFNVLFESVSNDTIFECRIDTSNRNYSFNRNNRQYAGGGTTYVYNGGSVIADMDANDTSTITHVGPTVAVHVSGAWSWFQGYLLG